MTKKKGTKRALLLSVLALVMCCSMLIGSTYAWFTDSVTSTNNKIESGTLKLDLEVLDKATGKWSSIKESKAPIFDYDKWEPGYTEVKVLRVQNEGTLALKWVAKFVSENELSALADVIDVYVLPSQTELSYPAGRDLTGYKWAGTVSDFVNTIGATTNGTLKANETAYLAIALKMQESAGNTYQGLSLGGAFDIQILATQLTYEPDTFDSTYDKNAWMEGMVIYNTDDLAAAFANGGSAVLGADIDLSDPTDTSLNKPIVIEEGVTVDLNLNGHSIKNAVIADAALINNGTLTINNSGSIANTVTKDQVTAAGITPETELVNASKTILNTGTLVINGGQIGSTTTPGNAVYNLGGTVTINGGTFASRQEAVKGEAYVGYAFLNNGGTMTINNATVSEPTHGLFACYDGTLTVNGGNYTLKGTNACYITYTTDGTVEIKGGNITVENTRNGYFMYAYNGSNQFGYKNVMNNTDSVVVTGGTFANKSTYTIDWDYIAADGYKAVKNEDGSWTVWKEVSTTAELTAAIENAQDGDTICLTSGTFNTALNLKGKSLTILGAGKDETIIAGPEDYTTENIPTQEWAGWYNGRSTNDDRIVYSLISANKDVTIKDLTVKADPEEIADETNFRDQGDYAFVGIHVQGANATIENVDIKGIKPAEVTGNDHHNFGLYITSVANDTNRYEVTYKNGTVSDVNRGGIYCWSGNYNLNFEDVTVVGPGAPESNATTLTPATGSENNKAIYAFCSFYVQSPATYTNVVIKNTYAVYWWGGASWSWGGNCANNAPTGVTCIDCGAIY